MLAENAFKLQVNEMSPGTLIWLQRAFDHSLFAPARTDTLDPHIVLTGYKKDIWALTAYPSSFVLCSCSFTASQRIFTVTTHSGLPVIA